MTTHRSGRLSLIAIAILTVFACLPMQSKEDGVAIAVVESLGQRRFACPVIVGVPLPRGAVSELEHVALYAETAAGESGPPPTPLRGVQYDVRSRWPDGSLQWVTVTVNRSPGPQEHETLRLRWGPSVSSPASGGGVVKEMPEAFVIRDVYRIPRKGPHFLTSVKYGSREYLRGPASILVQSFTSHAAPFDIVAGSQTSRVVSAGPVNAIVELRGSLRGAYGEELPFRLTLSQPNSKSWLDAVFEMENPQKEDGLTISLTVPYAVERQPIHYDFGTEGWVYGTLRGEEVAVFGAPRDGRWFVRELGKKNVTYAGAATKQSRFEGWAHLVDGLPGGSAIAFGSPEFRTPRGARGKGINISAKGDVTIDWLCRGARHARVQALFHHVSDPVQVSAATSPAAMLSPLRVTLPADWSRRCGAGRVPPSDWPPSPESTDSR